MTTISPFLARLKEATRPDHEATEQSVNMGARTKTLDGYRQVLCQFLGFYEPAEARLAPILGDQPVLEFQARRKTHLIKNDLRALGMADTAIEALPRYRQLPRVQAIPEAFGSMYVLEGATLGGQYIAKHLQNELKLAPGRGCDFFNSYGENVGPMWKAFREILDQAATNEENQETIITSARDTFSHFHRWFREHSS